MAMSTETVASSTLKRQSSAISKSKENGALRSALVHVCVSVCMCVCQPVSRCLYEKQPQKWSRGER